MYSASYPANRILEELSRKTYEITGFATFTQWTYPQFELRMLFLSGSEKKH